MEPNELKALAEKYGFSDMQYDVNPTGSAVSATLFKEVQLPDGSMANQPISLDVGRNNDFSNNVTNGLPNAGSSQAAYAALSEAITKNGDWGNVLQQNPPDLSAIQQFAVSQEHAPKMEAVSTAPSNTTAPESVPQATPGYGGLNLSSMEPGSTILYSHKNAPDQLITGTLLADGAGNVSLLNSQNQKESLSDAESRMAAVIGYAQPTKEGPLFVAGVDAQGKITDDPKSTQSYGVFHHNTDGHAVPVGQAVSPDLAETLKSHIENGHIPAPVDGLATVATLSTLRDMLNNPEGMQQQINPDQPAPDGTKPGTDPKKEPEEEDKEDKKDKKEIHQHIHESLLSHLFKKMTGQDKVASAEPAPDPQEWLHRAKAHMDEANRHIDAIAAHPAMQKYQEMANMPGMPDSAKAAYAQAILRNNPDLEARYRLAEENVSKAHDFAFSARNQNAPADAGLMDKADSLYKKAGQLPQLDAGAPGGGLMASLRGFFQGQSGPALNKP